MIVYSAWAQGMAKGMMEAGGAFAAWKQTLRGGKRTNIGGVPLIYPTHFTEEGVLRLLRAHFTLDPAKVRFFKGGGYVES